MLVAEYESRYKMFDNIVQLREPLRVWKKIMVLIDPSESYWSKRREAEECRIVVSNSGPYEFAVAELLIPSGALVYTEHVKYKMPNNSVQILRQFRSSSAVCVGITDGCGMSIQHGQSIYGLANNCRVDYETGKITQPLESFDLSHTIYASGIHFFADSEIAWAF